MSKEGFQSLMRKMEEFARANDRISVPERRRVVISLYRRLRRELAGEAKTGVRETGGSASIRILAKDGLIACDESDALLKLMAMANLLCVKRVGNQIQMDLWFRCWEWKKRT